MEETLKLTAPSPNPVSEKATFSFAVRRKTKATLTLWNVLGQRVKILYQGTPPPGKLQEISLNASPLSSGVYFLRLAAANQERTRQITVLDKPEPSDALPTKAVDARRNDSTQLETKQPEKSPSILSLNATPTPAKVGRSIEFTSNVQHADHYHWSFGDGISASGTTVTHTYEKPGQYTAELTARSPEGRDTRTVAVRVTPTEDEESPIIKRPRIDTEIPETAMRQPHTTAVVIGNEDYRNADIPSVDYAVRDAKVTKTYLTRTLGLREENVIYVENATAAALTRIFGTADDPQGQLYNWVQPGKSDVFVYYSGHGAPSPESEQAYLVPSDANPN